MLEFINRDKRAPGNGGGRHGLKKRYDEQVTGKCGPGTKSWDDHEDQYRGLWEKLQSYVQEFYERTEPPCVNLPSEISDWAMKAPPTPSEWKGDPNASVDPACNGEVAPDQSPVLVPEADTPSEQRQPDPGITAGDVADAVTAAAEVAAVVLVGAAVVAGAILLAPEAALAGAVMLGVGAIVGAGADNTPDDGGGA